MEWVVVGVIVVVGIGVTLILHQARVAVGRLFDQMGNIIHFTYL